MVYDEVGTLGQIIYIIGSWSQVTFLWGYTWWVDSDKLVIGERSL